MALHLGQPVPANQGLWTGRSGGARPAPAAPPQRNNLASRLATAVGGGALAKPERSAQRPGLLRRTGLAGAPKGLCRDRAGGRRTSGEAPPARSRHRHWEPLPGSHPCGGVRLAFSGQSGQHGCASCCPAMPALAPVQSSMGGRAGRGTGGACLRRPLVAWGRVPARALVPVAARTAWARQASG